MAIAVFESAAAPSVAERMLYDVGERCHLAECNLLLLRRCDPCREASVVVKYHHKCLNGHFFAERQDPFLNSERCLPTRVRIDFSDHILSHVAARVPVEAPAILGCAHPIGI